MVEASGWSDVCIQSRLMLYGIATKDGVLNLISKFLSEFIFFNDILKFGIF